MRTSYRIGRGMIPTIMLLAMLTSSNAVAQDAIDNLGDIWPAALSSDGSVALASRLTPNYQIIFWTAPSTETIITLPDPTRSIYESVGGLSADGKIVVGTDKRADADFDIDCNPEDPDWEPGNRPSIWKWQGGSASTVAPPDSYCYLASDVSNTGKIVGFVVIVDDEGTYVSHAMSYAGAFSDIHVPGYDYTYATRISADGKVIVGVGWIGGKQKALRWSENGVQVLFDGFPTDISDDGSVVTGIDEGQSYNTAVRWTESSLETVSTNGSRPIVSGNGEVVVYGTSGPFGPHNGPHQEIWTAAGGSQSVWQAVTDIGVDAGAWQFTGAAGVSYDGSIIMGRDIGLSAGYRVTLSPQCGVAKYSVLGEEIHWKAAANGSFEDGSNWEGDERPGSDSVAVFGVGSGSYEVALSQSETNRRLDVDGDDTIIRVNTGTYNLTGIARSIDGTQCSGPESIRVLGKASRPSTLTITAGGVSANADVIVGTEGPEKSTLTISGTGAALNVPAAIGETSNLIVGSEENTDGTVRVEGGATLWSNWIASYGRDVNSTGRITVENSGSRYESQLTILGSSGTGISELSNGGSAQILALKIGLEQGSAGAILVTDTDSDLIIKNSLEIGINGRGTITKTKGSQLSINEQASLVLGVEETGEGFLTIEETAPESDSLGVVTVGAKGPGTLEILKGADTAARTIVIGESAEGIVTIDGPDSKLKVFDDFVMASVGKTGSGTLNVTNGGHFTSAGELVIGAAPGTSGVSGDGRLEVSGSESFVGAPRLIVGRESYGSAIIEAATVSFPENVSVGVSAVSGDTRTSRLELSTGVMLETAFLGVGGGNGILRIRGASVVTAEGATTATGAGSRGEIFVEDPGSVLNVRGRLTIGESGQGLLNVFAGGAASIDSLQVNHGAISGSNIIVGATIPKAGRSLSSADGTISVGVLLLGDNAVLDVDAVEMLPGAIVGGSGTYPLNLVSSGEISPGDFPGHAASFSADSSYTQLPDGSLRIELGGTQEGTYDRFVIAETAHLAGTLILNTIDGFAPGVGDTFEILRAGQVEGVFEHIETDGDYVADIIYTETTVVVSITSFVGITNDFSDLPSTYVLRQNYPNPFNPTTTISYELPVTESVHLSVYDMLGRRVAPLVDTRQEAGTYRVAFDGSHLPSGVYTVRLRAGSFQADRTMVLLK